MNRQRELKKTGIQKAAAWLLCTACLLALCGCADTGKKNAPPSGDGVIDYYDLDISGISVGPYKGLEITEDLRVTEFDLAQAVYDDLQILESLNTTDSSGEITQEHELYSRYKEMLITDRAAEKGDNVFLSYVGYIDGKAFEGGTSDGTSLILGSGDYIPGFEEAVIGKMPGETFDIDISFPDPYPGNPDLSGKPVKFTATVRHIIPPLDDALAGLLASAYEEDYNLKHEKDPEAAPYVAEFTDAAEYRAVRSETIRKTKEDEFEDRVAGDLLKMVYDKTTFTRYPDGMFENLNKTLDSTAAQYGLDRDTYVLYMYGIATEEQYEEFSRYQVGTECIIAAVIQLENLTLTEQEQDIIAESYAKRYGLDSVEALYEAVSREELLNMMLSEKAMNFIVDAAVVNIVE